MVPTDRLKVDLDDPVQFSPMDPSMGPRVIFFSADESHGTRLR